MTSMPFTSSSGFVMAADACGAFMRESVWGRIAAWLVRTARKGTPEAPGSLAYLCGQPSVDAPAYWGCSTTLARRDVLVLRILRRKLLHQTVDVRLVGLVPIGSDLPLRTVPLHDARPVRAHVVRAAGLDRSHDLAEAECLETVRRQVQVLEAPAHLLGRHDLSLAEFLLRGANRLHLQHRDHHAARVRKRADLVGRARALALVVDELLQVVMHLVAGGAVVDRDRVVALRGGTEVLHVVIGARPPDRVDLLARKARALRFADRGGRHY